MTNENAVMTQKQRNEFYVSETKRLREGKRVRYDFAHVGNSKNRNHFDSRELCFAHTVIDGCLHIAVARQHPHDAPNKKFARYVATKRLFGEIPQKIVSNSLMRSALRVAATFEYNVPITRIEIKF